MPGVGHVIGIGTDIVSCAEFKTTLERTPEFLPRHFTANEIRVSQERRDPVLTLAGIFAAKESLLKAFGVGLFEVCELKEIEVSHHENGKPFFQEIPLGLKQRVKEAGEAFVSISHSDIFAVATVALVKK